MKLLATSIFVLCTVFSQAQIISKVDFDEIKKVATDSTSQFYYPTLVERMASNDTTFTHQEYHHLYYGAVFEELYYPYGSSNSKKKFLDAYKSLKYTEALSLGEAALKENPVDLEVLLKMSICCLKTNQDDQKRYYAKQYYSFLDVIYYSGTGKGLESAFVVISVDHEYYIAGDLGLRVLGQQLITDCDLLTFSKRDQKKIKGRKKIKQMFFNVRMPLLSLSKAFKDADLPDPDDE